MNIFRASLVGLSVTLFLILNSCATEGDRFIASAAGKGPLKLRFQNATSLEISQAGCSIVNYGGLDRLCAYAEKNKSDVFFQVGPAFSKSIHPEEHTADELSRSRKVLWDEWQKENVKFYAVSTEDFTPSFAAFDALTGKGGIARVNSNLMNAKKTSWIYKPYYLVSTGGKDLAFLNFSENQKPDPSGAWAVEDIEVSFPKVVAMLPKNITALHIAGQLPKETRLKIAKMSSKPVLFIGGTFTDWNSVGIVQEAPNSFWVKAPDLGRGVGEIEVGTEIVPSGKHKTTALGAFQYWYRPWILKKTFVPAGRCLTVVPAETSGSYTPCNATEKIGKDAAPCKGEDAY